MSCITAILDKSTLESLGTKEIEIFDKYFELNLIPILSFEVVNDLKKQPRNNHSSEYNVALLAYKLDRFHARPNEMHTNIVRNELLEGLQTNLFKHDIYDSRSPENRNGNIFYPTSPEEEKLYKWTKGNFNRNDYAIAERWNDRIKNLNLNELAVELKDIFSPLPTFKDLKEIKGFVDKEFNHHSGAQKALEFLVDHHNVDNNTKAKLFYLWHTECNRQKKIICPFDWFPYSTYLYKLHLFYLLGLYSGLIKSGKEAKTHIDHLYLYYLPFCQVFISNDKYHLETAPLFLTGNQKIISGEELQKDLIEIRAVLCGLSKEQKRKYDYKSYPPERSDSIICNLFDTFCPGWRKEANNPIELTPELNKFIMDQFDNAKGARIFERKATKEKAQSLFSEVD